MEHHVQLTYWLMFNRNRLPYTFFAYLGLSYRTLKDLFAARWLMLANEASVWGFKQLLICSAHQICTRQTLR